MKLLTLELVSFSLVFFVTLVFTQGSSYLTSLYIELWLLLVSIRSFTFYYYKKKSLFFLSFKSALHLILWSNTLITFISIFILSITTFSQIPRSFAVQFLVYPIIIDVIIVCVKSRRSTSKEKKTKPLSLSEAKKSLSPIDFLGWLVNIFIAYHITILTKYHAVSYNAYTLDILLLILPAWLLSALFTQKYLDKNNHNIYLIIGQHLKSTIILVTLLGFPHFFFRMDYLSRYLLFGTALISSLFELILASSKHLYKQSIQEHLQSINDITDEHGEVKQDILPNDQQLAQTLLSEDKHSKFISLIKAKNPGDLHAFLQEVSAEIMMDRSSLSLLSTTSTESINIQTNNSVLVNFHRCNDQRRLNKYLIACHRSLDDGGILVGYFEPLEIVTRNLRKKLPRILFHLITPFHFVFHRIFPKMKFLNFLYFHITRGKNRVISKAEMFGRLSYCGFDIISEIPLDGMIAFIAQRTKTISSELKPSFKAIVSLKRVGFNGETIDIYKVRTMHPYSEFLQKYVYDSLSLDDSGKFNNDFRLTSWGKVFRKMWIDELPQLYNWIRGDVKLVGVRALSYHYFSLYPDHIKQLRIRSKPGLVPPYYVDLPQNFDEIIESEEKYLNSYLKRPIYTDVTYFFLAFRNIVLRGARSH
jgi:lipopolysaccharide/colanic/teichoic acid biosynthesis glycosyltransferase